MKKSAVLILSLVLLISFVSAGWFTGNVIWDTNYCTDSNKCVAGEGDCRRDSNCLTDYCAKDVGDSYYSTLYDFYKEKYPWMRDNRIERKIGKVDVCECPEGTNWDGDIMECVDEEFMGNFCIDSDGGLNYYEKGILNQTFSPANPKEDVCLDSNTIMEWSCVEEGTFRFDEYICSNGCVDGACVEEVQNANTIFLNESADDDMKYFLVEYKDSQFDESYVFRFDIISEDNVDKIRAKEYAVYGGMDKKSKVGDDMNFGSVAITPTSIIKDGIKKWTTIKFNEGTSITKLDDFKKPDWYQNIKLYDGEIIYIITPNANDYLINIQDVAQSYASLIVNGEVTNRLGEYEGYILSSGEILMMVSMKSFDYVGGEKSVYFYFNQTTNQTQTNTISICTDSDGGLNAFVFGKTNVSYSPSVLIDGQETSEFIHEDSCFEAGYSEYYIINETGSWSREIEECENPINVLGNEKALEVGDCTISGLKHESLYGPCSGNDCYIEEAYCNTPNNDGIYDADADEFIYCPNGCQDGACISNITNQTTSNTTCTDSDGGLNYYGRGQIIVKDSLGNIIASDWDDCNEEEFFCYENGSAGFVGGDWNCPGVCQDGACVCYDSDDGDDFFTKGYVISRSGDEEVWDSCKDRDTLIEVNCDEQGGSFVEYECDNRCSDRVCVEKGFWKRMRQRWRNLFN